MKKGCRIERSFSVIELDNDVSPDSFGVDNNALGSGLHSLIIGRDIHLVCPAASIRHVRPIKNARRVWTPGRISSCFYRREEGHQPKLEAFSSFGLHTPAL